MMKKLDGARFFMDNSRANKPCSCQLASAKGEGKSSKAGFALPLPPRPVIPLFEESREYDMLE